MARALLLLALAALSFAVATHASAPGVSTACAQQGKTVFGSTFFPNPAEICTPATSCTVSAVTSQVPELEIKFSFSCSSLESTIF